MQIFRRLFRFTRKSSRERREATRALARIYRRRVRGRLEDWGWGVPRLASDRTAYVIGLFGSGRAYLEHQLRDNIGVRERYLRPSVIRLHPRPTSMIYCGHATIRYASRNQSPPEVTSRVFEAVRARIADLIFIYRHPLDSLLTNWVWWRSFHRDSKFIYGINTAFKRTDDFCEVLERNFADFKVFAEGDPSFFGPSPGLPFLSFRQYVEETELYLQAPTLAIRFEDCFIDPSKEFAKIARVMSIDFDLSRAHVLPPLTRPYRYLAVREKVPQFRDFIDGLDAETKRRIEKIGYNVDAPQQERHPLSLCSAPA